jgi:hypothetical protein
MRASGKGNEITARENVCRERRSKATGCGNGKQEMSRKEIRKKNREKQGEISDSHYDCEHQCFLGRCVV